MLFDLTSVVSSCYYVDDYSIINRGFRKGKRFFYLGLLLLLLLRQGIARLALGVRPLCYAMSEGFGPKGKERWPLIDTLGRWD